MARARGHDSGALARRRLAQAEGAWARADARGAARARQGRRCAVGAHGRAFCWVSGLCPRCTQPVFGPV